MMFSATYPKAIKDLVDSAIKNPLNIEISKINTAASDIKQLVHPVESDRKRALLYNLIVDEKWERVLVFTRTRRKADKVARQMKTDGIKSAALHSDKTQAERTLILEEFKRGKIKALIATDVAARGLDIRDLPHVVNFDLPEIPEYYVHRIGRTGRAGKKGVAVSFVCRDEIENLSKIEEFINQKITLKRVQGFDYDQTVKKKPGRATNTGNKKKGIRGGKRKGTKKKKGKTRRGR